jgi:hypothetical protein
MPSAIWFNWQCLQIHLFCTPQVLFHPPQEIWIVTECLCIVTYSTLEAFLCPVKLPDNGENEGIRIRNHIIVIKLHTNKETSTTLVAGEICYTIQNLRGRWIVQDPAWSHNSVKRGYDSEGLQCYTYRRREPRPRFIWGIKRLRHLNKTIQKLCHISSFYLTWT